MRCATLTNTIAYCGRDDRLNRHRSDTFSGATGILYPVYFEPVTFGEQCLFPVFQDQGVSFRPDKDIEPMFAQV